MSWIYYWPTVFWMVGYAEFLLRTTVGGPVRETGYYSWGASLLFLVTAMIGWRAPILLRFRHEFRELLAGPKTLWVLIGLQLLIFALGLAEARLPPHLVQEYDAVFYHMGLARQHLMTGSLGPISWSAADLWPMPVQLGSATYWFSSPIFHKIPQWIFSFWAFGLLTRLGTGSAVQRWLIACAVFTTHGIVIQIGTAMFDLSILYCLIAFLHAMHRKSVLWAALNLALFATSKAFMPLQTGAILAPILIGFWIWNRAVLLQCRSYLFKLAAVFLLCFGLLLSRTAYLGAERAGTPLFPFLTCAIPVAPCEGESGNRVRESSRLQIQTRDAYGAGRGPLPLLNHFWRVAVPTHGVNNEYDYPLGLSWLLLLTLAIGAVAKRKELTFTPFEKWVGIAALLFWGSWWMGSQQSRWLYPVLALGWLALRPVIAQSHRGLLSGILACAAAISLVSQYHSYTSRFWSDRLALQKMMEAGAAKNHLELLYQNEVIGSAPGGSHLWVLE